MALAPIICKSYHLIILYLLLCMVALLASGSAIYFLHIENPTTTFDALIKSMTPHFFSMSLMAFILLHFFYFAHHSRKTGSYSLLIILFNMTILLEQFSPLLTVYVPFVLKSYLLIALLALHAYVMIKIVRSIYFKPNFSSQ